MTQKDIDQICLMMHNDQSVQFEIVKHLKSFYLKLSFIVVFSIFVAIYSYISNESFKQELLSASCIECSSKMFDNYSIFFTKDDDFYLDGKFLKLKSNTSSKFLYKNCEATDIKNCMDKGGMQ